MPIWTQVVGGASPIVHMQDWQSVNCSWCILLFNVSVQYQKSSGQNMRKCITVQTRVKLFRHLMTNICLSMNKNSPFGQPTSSRRQCTLAFKIFGPFGTVYFWLQENLQIVHYVRLCIGYWQMQSRLPWLQIHNHTNTHKRRKKN